jgi:cytochrome c553
VCDPSGDGGVAATDALLCLNSAVGTPVTLSCPCGGNAANGQDLYDTQCGFCHSAGAHDPVSEIASDLAGDGALLVGDLGTLSSAMDGIALTDQDIADLTAFLDGL